MLLSDHIEYRQTNGARNGVAAEGIEIFHAVIERVRDFRRGDYGRQGMSIADWFAHRHNIGYDSLRLESPEVRADSPKTNLHFIGDANAARVAYVTIGLLK